MRLGLLLAGLMVPTVAPAAPPIYLACTLTTAAGPMAVTLTVDDVSRSVLYEAAASGYSAQRSATFSSDKIAFDVPMTVGAADFTVSRLDLAITRTIATSGVPVVDQGRCVRQKLPKKRAF